MSHGKATATHRWLGMYCCNYHRVITNYDKKNLLFAISSKWSALAKIKTIFFEKNFIHSSYMSGRFFFCACHAEEIFVCALKDCDSVSFVCGNTAHTKRPYTPATAKRHSERLEVTRRMTKADTNNNENTKMCATQNTRKAEEEGKKKPTKIEYMHVENKLLQVRIVRFVSVLFVHQISSRWRQIYFSFFLLLIPFSWISWTFYRHHHRIWSHFGGKNERIKIRTKHVKYSVWSIECKRKRAVSTHRLNAPIYLVIRYEFESRHWYWNGK